MGRGMTGLGRDLGPTTSVLTNNLPPLKKTYVNLPPMQRLCGRVQVPDASEMGATANALVSVLQASSCSIDLFPFIQAQVG
uniref:Uncharacterized protein n=1 Tax=Xenopus tropicalis TaxID=8364 RepID=A0A1B8XZW7_XENTR